MKLSHVTKAISKGVYRQIPQLNTSAAVGILLKSVRPESVLPARHTLKRVSA